MYYFRVSNRRETGGRGQNKGEAGKFRHKMINGEGTINGEVSKNLQS